MHLRSGYETPPEFGAWKYEPDEYDSDTDTKKHVFDTTKAVTSQSRGQVPYDQNVYVSGTQAEKVPSWVPATLPSCVPGPRPNQPVQPPSSSSQTNMSNIAGNNNPQSSGAMHFPLTPSTPSNNLDQELPLVPGHVFPFSGNNPDAVVDPFTMGFAGSHLPPQPLEGGAGSFFDFNFQAPLPTGVPDFELDLDLDLDLGLSMAMDVSSSSPLFLLLRIALSASVYPALCTSHSVQTQRISPSLVSSYTTHRRLFFHVVCRSSNLRCPVLLCLRSLHSRTLLSPFCCFLALATLPAHTRSLGGLSDYCTNSLSDCFPARSWAWIQLPSHSRVMLSCP